MAMFLHKIVLAIVKVENEKYTSLLNRITSLVAPTVCQSHEDKNQKYVCQNQKSTYYCDDKITSISQSA